MSLICCDILIIITKEDKFYCIHINNENISSFIMNNDNSVIEQTVIKDLCYKQINDIKINYQSTYCFACNENEYNIYYYDIEYWIMKEYISEEKVDDICCGYRHLILLTSI